MKKAIVTGGCGFIGSSIAKKLVEDGWIVDIVDDLSSGRLELVQELSPRVIPADLLLQFYENNPTRKDTDIHVIQGDFSHENVLANIMRKEYTHVFHQAAIPRVLFSVENPSYTTDVNISGTVRLFEACKGNVERIVYASSSSVYGGSENLPTPETEAKDPKSPYAWQKSATEDIAKIFSNLYNMDIVCLRYFNVFGPGQYGDSAYSTAISAWCHNLVNGLPMRSDGDGTQSRDLCYIDNVVHANILAATSLKKFKADSYNIACGDRTSNNEILTYFKDKFPQAIARSAPWRQGDVMHTCADISKAKKDLGYEPLVRFWEGLERTIVWWGLDS